MSTSDDLVRRVCDIVAATFGVPAADVGPKTGMDTIEAWDSMNHLHLVVALEGELGVSFEPDVAVELTSVGAIVEAVRRLQK
jgi:acyl carrier protein